VLCPKARFQIHFLCKITVTTTVYLDMLQNWLMPQLNEHVRENLIVQHNQALRRYHNAVIRFLKQIISARWIGLEAANVWPARSPHLIPKDFSLLGMH
jgi:hypothetical protein